MCSWSQKLEPNAFATLSAFHLISFEDEGFAKFEVGLGLFTTYWISPEISLVYNAGRLKDLERLQENPPYYPQARLFRNYDAWLFSIGAKLRVTKREDVWLFIMPKYSAGNFNFKSSYITFREGTGDVFKNQDKVTNSYEGFFDFAIGLEGYLDGDEKLLGSFSASYTLMDLKDGIRSLESESPYFDISSSSTQTFGVVFKLHYVF